MDIRPAFWIVTIAILGLAQTLAADGTTSDIKSDSAKTLVKTENDVTSTSPANDNDHIKHNIGGSENSNYQSRSKRNFGRWKNRRWHMLNLADTGDAGYLGQHSLSKRYTDSDFNDNDVAIPYVWFEDEFPESGEPNFIMNGGGANLDENDDAVDELTDNDKRHASRWKLIHQKLASLNNNNKRADEVMPEDKRMSGRWRLIQNKLDQLRGNADKRNAGRWRNYNWLLRQYTKQNDDNLAGKRNFGRWRNRNWIMQRYGHN